MSKLLLDDFVSRNPDSLVTITHGRSGVSLTGIISNPELSQTLSAQYGDGAKGLVGKAGSFLSGKNNRFAKGAGMILDGINSYNTSKDTMMGTVKLYEGSGSISMPFNVTIFYDWQGNPGFKDLDLQLNLLTQPKLNPGGLLGSNLYDIKTLTSILATNYNALQGKLIYVTLGDWFRAKDVYITNLVKNSSTILNEDEYPMAMNVTFNIEPYRQLTAQELNEWIL